MRVADNDREVEAPAIVIRDVQIEVGVPLPWSDRGKLFPAIGGVVPDLAGAS